MSTGSKEVDAPLSENRDCRSVSEISHTTHGSYPLCRLDLSTGRTFVKGKTLVQVRRATGENVPKN